MARLKLLGVELDRLTVADLNQCIAEAIAQGEQRIMANHNLHSVYLYHRNPRMRAFFARARVVHIDGMPLVYWARILGYAVRATERVTYLDWVHPLMAAAQVHGWRVFYLGGRPGVAARAAERLRHQYPGLTLEVRHGYFSREENESVLQQLTEFRPNVLMVGMGMPRQEIWVLENLDRIQANAILTAGACFDYLAGAVPTPPRWMGRAGLEWLYRLLSEPRRLWRRYLVEPWALAPLFVKDLRRLRKR